LVSHDRDFLDRVATTTLAFEGNGVVTPYAGGWTDYQTQKKLRGGDDAVVKKAGKKKQKGATAPVEKVSEGMTFAQTDRLEKLPALMERTEAEIAKLEEFLSQPDLFTEHPVKFQKATDGLIERHEVLAKLEEEWMELEALKEA
jgi:ATP-binding cassette subfamily F protein uup